MFNAHARDFGCHRQQVIGERGRRQLTICVVAKFFEKGAADSLRHPAMNLAFHNHRVNQVAAVIDRDVVEHLDEPGCRIHFHLGNVGTIGIGDLHRRPIAGDDFKTRLHAIRHAGDVRVGDLCEFANRERTRRNSGDLGLAVAELNVLFARFEQVGRQLGQLGLHFPGRSQGRAPANGS